MKHEILIIAGRVLVATVFIVMGGERLLVGAGLLDSVQHFSTGVLLISAFEVIIGLLIAWGWKLRWLASVMALLMLADAVGSHPFWSVAPEEQHGQLLHFAKNMAIIGGCLLLTGLEGALTGKSSEHAK